MVMLHKCNLWHGCLLHGCNETWGGKARLPGLTPLCSAVMEGVEEVGTLPAIELIKTPGAGQAWQGAPMEITGFFYFIY